MGKFKINTTPVELNELKPLEIDYSKVYIYFPLDEILEEDEPFINDYRRLGTKDAVASIPHSIALKYESYKKLYDSPEYQNLHWYA